MTVPAQLSAVVEQVARPRNLAGDGGANPTPRLQSSEWWVVPIPHAEAVALTVAWHYSRSASNTSVYRFGLERRDNPLLRWGTSVWGLMSPGASKSVAGDSWGGVLACSRLCVDPNAPKNAASFLLAHSRRQIDRARWPVLVSYADTRLGHTGAIYRADGWTFDRSTPAGDVWIGPNGEQRGRKRGPHNLSVPEMRARGFSLAPSFPKLRFVHRAVA